jgi:hypothetical protein
MGDDSMETRSVATSGDGVDRSVGSAPIERRDRLDQMAKMNFSPEFDDLIKRDSVSWGDITGLHFSIYGSSDNVWDGKPSDDDDEASNQISNVAYLSTLKEAYAIRFGGIESEYFTTSVIGSAVFTKRGEFVHVLNTDNILDRFNGSNEQWVLLINAVGQLTGLLAEIDEIYRLARSFSGATESEPSKHGAPKRDLFLHRVALDLYSLTTAVLAETDRLYQLTHGDVPIPEDQWDILVNMGHDTSLQTVPAQLTSVRERVESEKKRRAIARYISGLAVGAVILPAVMIATFVFTTLTPTDSGVFLLVVTAASGAIGAAVSVMLRVSRSNLEVGEDQQKWVLFLSGMFRPFLGAVFGTAFYVLTVGGLLPLDVPDDTTKAAFFFAGVAFLAGFSEQLAQDVFVRTGGALGNGVSAAPDEAATDG